MENFNNTFVSNNENSEAEEGVYYRLYKTTANLITIICMQYFDECDYDKTQYVRNSNGMAYYFFEEEDAIKQLNEWYEPEQIDPEFRKKDDDKLLIR